MPLKVFFLIITIVLAVHSQTDQPIDRPSALEAVGLPSFTEKAQYNSYDFCGSPLGLFKKDSIRVRLNLGVRSTSWHEADHADSLKQSATAWNVPDILIGKPGIMYVRLSYTPTSIDDYTHRFTSNTNSGFQKLSLPLQRFGLQIAGQTPSGIFQMSVRGNGYYGDEVLAGSQNTRLIMGLENLSAAIGSRLHPLIAIGMQGGAIGKLDTLRYFQSLQMHDRYFFGQIPQLGWYIDFGGNSIPVSSDFSLQIATHRFVYVTRLDEDRNPIRGDSLAWKWQTIGDIAGWGCTWHPALCLGYWSNHYQTYLPTTDNNNLDVGKILDGNDWQTSNFRFGFGTSAQILELACAWFEYTHASLSLHYGTAWPLSAKKQKGYDRIMLGVEARVHKIAALQIPKSTEAFVRLGYFNQRENSVIDAFESEQFEQVNSVDYNSMIYRYSPDLGWGPDQRVIGFTIGIGCSFFNRLLSADAHVAFLSKSAPVRSGGAQLGVDCAYTLR